ncbi:MAG: nucleotidyltransferase domain-containing protein [Nanoarchaeota archaeon]|nr:nucleotidyltransferase domain-containing protein [Nanoarchaeota archaeon]
MLHTNKLKIMQLFFEQPSKYFQIREISRLTKLAVTSVKNYLDELKKEELILRKKAGVFPAYIANQENRMFKVYKQADMFLRIYSCGLVDFLEENLHPRSIILFGSVRKGEYTKESDIDIFVETKEKSLNLSKYEKKIKHKINLYFKENINNLSKELFNNIINGIKLSGYIKIKCT